MINEILRAPFFVPNSIMISRLLRGCKEERYMAVVIDEHGDLDGLVTIEASSKEIVGEIEDEYDVGKGGLIESSGTNGGNRRLRVFRDLETLASS